MAQNMTTEPALKADIHPKMFVIFGYREYDTIHRIVDSVKTIIRMAPKNVIFFIFYLFSEPRLPGLKIKVHQKI